MIKKIVLLILLTTTPAWAFTPPAGSPLALGDHPRLGFISDTYRSLQPNAIGYTVGEMRKKLGQTTPFDYKSVLQKYIKTLDDLYGMDLDKKTIDGCANPDPISGIMPVRGRVYTTYDAIGYAFLAMLDPQNMSGLTVGHTANEYATEAIRHAVYLATKVTNANLDNSYEAWQWADRYITDYKTESWVGEGPVNMSIAVVNDWLNKKLTLDQKQLMLGAIIDLGTNAIPIDPFAAAKHFGHGQNGAGIIGFYGDSLGSNFDTAITALMTTVENNWIRSFKDLSAKLFGNGLSNAIEGPAYNAFIGGHALPFLTLFSSAMNENFIQTSSFMRGYTDYSLYTILPLKLGGQYRVLSSDDAGTLADMSLQYGNKQSIWDGLIHNSDEETASLARWLRENRYNTESSTRAREFDVLIYFFNGWKEKVTAKSPSVLKKPLSKDIGMGQYVMRTGFESENDTMISFFAPKYHLDTYHAHRDFAQFRIFKYGILAPDRQISKSYSVNVPETQNNMFYNTIGVLKDSETSNDKNFMAYRSNFVEEKYPDTASYSENGVNHVGTVVGEDLEMINYDYIDYDYSNSWNDDKVDYAEREFIYLRSNGGSDDEYVIIFDRINAINAAYKKFFLLHANFEPQLLNNANQAITMTPEDYPNDPDGGGGRWVNASSSPLQDNVIKITNNFDNQHAVLFNKTLWPSSFQINRVGGADHQWETANGKLLNGVNSQTMDDYFQSKWASHTMQIQSKTNKQYDTFLNVMQIGDSKTLTKMTAVDKITASGANGDMQGTLILDSTKNRVVLFNQSKSTDISKVQTPISYTISPTAPGMHLLLNVMPNSTYTIKRDGILLCTAKSNNSGAMKFEDAHFGPNIVYSVENNDPAPMITNILAH